MTERLIREVPGGYEVDGLLLLGGKCDHTGARAVKETAAQECCHTFSSVTREGNLIAFFAKMAPPHCPEPQEWGYRVAKGGVVVDVLVYDCKETSAHPQGGHYPPPLAAWEERGWEVISRFRRPLLDQTE